VAGVGFLLTLTTNGPAWVAPLAYMLIVIGCLGTLAEIIYAFILTSRQTDETDTSSEALADRGGIAVAGVAGDVNINHHYGRPAPSAVKPVSRATEWRQQSARWTRADNLEILLAEGRQAKKDHASSQTLDAWRERVIDELPMTKREEFRHLPSGGLAGTIGGSMVRTTNWDMSLGFIETTIGELRGD
jgi:hypothetical protein